MFNQKWEKAPPSLFNYLKHCNRSEKSPLLRMHTWLYPYGIFYLILGVLVGACSFEFSPPTMDVWPLAKFFHSSTMIISSASDAIPIISSEASIAPAFSGKKADSPTSDPGSSSPKIPVDPGPKSPILVPENPDQDNGQVIVTYKSKIEETQHLLRTVNETKLSKEQRDTLNSIHSFLEKAQEAFSQDDMPMAVNLAEKAHTLTKEIVGNSTKR
jgi:hypothetical protein